MRKLYPANKKISSYYKLPAQWFHPFFKIVPEFFKSKFLHLAFFTFFLSNAYTQCPTLTFNLSGGGAICAGSSGVTISLDGSESGIDYYLINSSDTEITSLAGTGSPLDFNNIIAADTYTIGARDPGNTCTPLLMNGTATVTIILQPTVADAGPDQTGASTCGLTTVTLAANTASVGTGNWNIVTGTGGSFNDATSPNSTFTGVPGTAYVLKWTISNSPCPASTDDVNITLNEIPTIATIATSPLNYCGALASGSLGGNSPAVGTGTWSQVSGPGTSTFSAPSSGTSTATVSVTGTYVFRWTISNGTCTPSTADVTVNYYAAPSTATVVTSPLNYCGTLTSGQLGGNLLAVGTGAWSQVSGPGTSTFSSPS